MGGLKKYEKLGLREKKNLYGKEIIVVRPVKGCGGGLVKSQAHLRSCVHKRKKELRIGLRVMAAFHTAFHTVKEMRQIVFDRSNLFKTKANAESSVVS